MADNSALKTDGTKTAYETPTLNAVGSFEALTKWAGSGWALDAGFTAGTPVQNLTFSDPPPAS